MITWLIVLTIWSVLVTSALVGLLFRTNRMDDSIARQEMGLLQHKLDYHKDET